jgi:hopanoid biosynthesis associated RND transporter like protein HpnN
MTGRVLFWLADALYNHRRWFFYPQLVLVGLSIFYTIENLKFLTSRDALVGGEKKYHRDYLKYKEEFPVQDDLVVVVESENTEKNRQFVERLGAKLEAETNLFTSVFYKGDLKTMGPKALLFLPEDALTDLLHTLQEYKPFLVRFTRATNLVSLFDLVNTNFRTARREETDENKALVKALPALERIIVQATDALMRPGNPPSPGVNALFEGGKEAEQQMYITYGNGRIYLVTAQAPTEDLNEDAVKRMRDLIRGTQMEVPGLNVGLTGEPVLEVDEMEQSQKDTTRATIVSLIAVALIFIYGYNETGRPIKATLCLLVGLAYTMGFTTLAVGHLNILTITFVPILIGLAIDFGVHLITRYEEELRHGRSEKYALEKAIVYTGMGIFTGAFTTAGAFFAMAFTDFKGIREMGIICGGGLLVCLVPMMTLLPVLLLRGRQNVLDHELGPVLDRQASAAVDRRARIENAWLRRPVIVIGIIVVLSALALWPARRVRFDYNLLHMQSAGLPAVVFQDKLIQSSTSSVLFAAVVADSLPQATNLIAQITNLSSVAKVETMVGYLTENSSNKLALLRQIKQVASEIHFEPLDLRPVDLRALDSSLYSLHGYCGLAADSPELKDDPDLREKLLSLREAVSRLRSRLLVGNEEEMSQKLAEFQQALFNDVRDTFQAIRTQDDREPMRETDLPAPLHNRFVGVNSKYLIQVYPKKDVWGRAEQEEFIMQLRTLVPDVTGTPVQLYEYTGLLKKSFQQAAWYSLIAIALLVFLHFRKISAVVLSLLPVAFGSLWMVGIMGWFNIPFNPANVMTLPLIIGIGVTNGIHILNRFAEEHHPSILARSTGKAVLVSGLTAIAGFGSLALAEHRGIRSLGEIMATGVTTCMVVGLTFVPAILNLLNKHGWTIQKTQRDNARSTLGREEPR